MLLITENKSVKINLAKGNSLICPPPPMILAIFCCVMMWKNLLRGLDTALENNNASGLGQIF